MTITSVSSSTLLAAAARGEGEKWRDAMGRARLLRCSCAGGAGESRAGAPARRIARLVKASGERRVRG